MKKVIIFLSILAVTSVAAVIIVSMASCGSNNDHDYEQAGECFFDNPIDSIVQHTDASNRFDEVYRYLLSHPGFIDSSDAVGFYYYACNEMENAPLWIDCGDIRLYSIPWESIHSALAYNIVQIKGKTGEDGLDTQFLKDNQSRMDYLFKVTDRMGKTYYVLKTNYFVSHQGVTYEEGLCAFSLENGQLVKEKLFHARSGQYDAIEVECGGHRYLPLDFSDVVLICLDNVDEDDNGVPVVVVAEINTNGWPTGFGLKYQWTGDCFEYVGKCHYDAEGIIRD